MSKLNIFMRVFVLIFILLGFNICHGQNGQLVLTDSLHSEFEIQVDSTIQDAIDSMAFPGAQVLVMKDGEVVFEKAYGHHTYDSERKVNTNHLYDLASITKVSTGLPLLMNLVAKSKIDLDAPISDYISLFKKSNKSELTIREILAHQAQLKPYIVYWKNTINEDGSWKRRTFKNKRNNRYAIPITDSLFLHKKYYKKIQKAIKESEMLDKKEYRYSGLFFLLLPSLIENYKDRPLVEVLQHELYNPIGIKDLTYNPLDKYPIDVIVPTERDSFFRNQLVHGRVHDEAAAMLGGISCNAGLFGNARSLGRLFQVYLDHGQSNGIQLIDSTTLSQFTQCQYCETDNRRGLGFDKPLIEYDEVLSTVSRDASPESFGHSGFTGTLVWADPKYDLIYVFLSNRVYPTRNQRNIYKMNVRPKIHQLVYDYFTNAN